MALGGVKEKKYTFPFTNKTKKSTRLAKKKAEKTSRVITRENVATFSKQQIRCGNTTECKKHNRTNWWWGDNK